MRRQQLKGRKPGNIKKKVDQGHYTEKLGRKKRAAMKKQRYQRALVDSSATDVSRSIEV